MADLTSIRFRPVPRLLTLLGVLALCAGSSSRGCSFRDSNNDGDGGDNPDFVATLQLQDASGNVTGTFERNELIQMILTVRNRTDDTQTLTFTTTRTSDFLVVREGTDDVVWQLSEETGPPTTTPTTMDFAPDETKTFTTTWDQTRSDSGDTVSTGAYEARGVIIFDGFEANPLRASQLGSPLERFTIN
jgi:hypothetical protein